MPNLSSPRRVWLLFCLIAVGAILLASLPASDASATFRVGMSCIGTTNGTCIASPSESSYSFNWGVSGPGAEFVSLTQGCGDTSYCSYYCAYDPSNSPAYLTVWVSGNGNSGSTSRQICSS